MDQFTYLYTSKISPSLASFRVTILSFGKIGHVLPWIKILFITCLTFYLKYYYIIFFMVGRFDLVTSTLICFLDLNLQNNKLHLTERDKVRQELLVCIVNPQPSRQYPGGICSAYTLIQLLSVHNQFVLYLEQVYDVFSSTADIVSGAYLMLSCMLPVHCPSVPHCPSHFFQIE